MYLLIFFFKLILLNGLNSHFRSNAFNSGCWSCYFFLHQRENAEVPFNTTKRNEEPMHECFPKHSRLGTARMKYDKENEEKYKKIGVSMESSLYYRKVGTKK